MAEYTQRASDLAVERPILDNRHAVLLAFLAVTVIGAWIGWTMTTTPPPKPIEDAVSETKESETKTEQEQPNSTG
jgi:predicted DNA-binding transcriptional regulator